MDSTHPSLLERLRDFGDHAAWREFDARYRELILRYCHRCGMQSADAEDIRQVAVLELARGLDRFVYRPELGRFRDYLGTIVRNLIRHHFTRRQRAAERPLSDAADVSAESEREALWDEEWTLHHYRTAMQRVRESFHPRSVEIFDAMLAGRSVDELMRQFETTRDVVYKIKQRVRERLTRLITEQLQDEDLPSPQGGDS
jgi:RNA polymerase sigma factor (sigma-70 family)